MIGRNFNIIAIVALLFPGTSAIAGTMGDLFKQVDPAIVVIYTSSSHKEATTSRGETRLVEEKGLGSGVVVSKDGLIMTASHVVHTADKVTVAHRAGIRGGTLNAKLGNDNLLLGGDVILRVENIEIGIEEGTERIRELF